MFYFSKERNVSFLFCRLFWILDTSDNGEEGDNTKRITVLQLRECGIICFGGKGSKNAFAMHGL